MVSNQSLPKAERMVLDASPDCGAYRWTGEANGMTVVTHTPNPDVVLYVRASANGRYWILDLVDDAGKIYARQMRY